MNYAEIKYNDIANGVGVRTSLFVSGCSHHCKGCFNEIAWDYNYGEEFTSDVLLNDILKSLEPDYITGLSILGGEPLDQDEHMLELIKQIKERYPDKTIWMWTGYTYEELTDKQMEIVKLLDVLVDGPFIISKRCPNKRFRGSMNQRIIDIKKTIKSGTITHYYS